MSQTRFQFLKKRPQKRFITHHQKEEAAEGR